MPDFQPSRALFPGTFDPITNGHLDLIRRGAELFNELIVVLAVHPEKSGWLSEAERTQLIQESVESLGPELAAKVEVRSWSGLLVDAANKWRAGVLLRGLRGAVDFEYELSMAHTNADLLPGIETIFLGATPKSAHISSTLVRQIAQMQGDVQALVPAPVYAHIRQKQQS